MVDGHVPLVTKDQNEAECQTALLTVKWPELTLFETPVWHLSVILKEKRDCCENPSVCGH